MDELVRESLAHIDTRVFALKEHLYQKLAKRDKSCTVFQRLKEYGLIVCPEKYVFGSSSMEFLGHRVTTYGCVPLPEKENAIQQYPRLMIVKELQQSLECLTTAIGSFRVLHLTFNLFMLH
ncbi:hypothetical protein CAPTEDRAFT_204760 [Capitella teleta]|uniref:Uncharacterized protein n=1 Tax=Capitella teleta TaxID=283909 RepID=R7T847_CAPTE|nr:hypothetical protein CAPTEDRAFT_204760 [Capitella teleta]|eukprot:ELT89844.1 hypothetical protein CAPTEDRAFT_204760 [Capitella teleta]